MATMYSIFLSFLLTALCSVKGSRSSFLALSIPSSTHPSFSMTRTYFFSAKKYTKNSSLKPRSALRSKTFDTKSVHPSTIVKNFVGDKGREFTEHASLYYGPRSFDDLLAYGVKGRKATSCHSVHFALGQESQSKGGIRGQAALGPALVALRSRDEHRINSLDLCGTFYQGKVPRQSANEDNCLYPLYWRYTGCGEGGDRTLRFNRDLLGVIFIYRNGGYSNGHCDNKSAFLRKKQGCIHQI